MTSFDTWPPIAVAGTGSAVPDRVVTNDDLVALGIDTTDAWIQQRVGIGERRWATESDSVVTLAAAAAQAALDMADAHADDVDLIVLATSTPLWGQPATATAVHHALKLRADAGAFDVNAVCSGYLYALHAAAAMLAGSESWTSVLVVGADTYSTITADSDRTTRVIFGDGAGAVLLRKELELADLAVLAADEAGVALGSAAFDDLDGGALDEETPGLRSIVYTTDGSGRDALVQPHGQPLRMDAPAVRAFAVPALEHAVREACDAAAIEPHDLALVVPHQSNRRMLEAAIDALGLPEARLATTIERFGNTAAASIPLTLDHAVRAGRLRDGDLVCLAGYGSGVQSAGAVLRWRES